MFLMLFGIQIKFELVIVVKRIYLFCAALNNDNFILNQLNKNRGPGWLNELA